MKQRNQILILIALLAVAAVVWTWRSKASPVTGAPTAQAQNYSPLAVENPALHWWKLDQSRKTEYKSSGRNPFSAVALPPEPLPAPKPGDSGYVPKPGDPDYVPPLPPPPQLPANLKFFGYGTVPVGSGRLAFFTDGNDVYITGEGDVLLGRYRIVKIGNANLEFEEVGTGRRGAAMLEDQSTPG